MKLKTRSSLVGIPSSSEYKRLFESAILQGWTITKERKHIKLMAPNGAIIFTSTSTGDKRAIKNCISVMKRLGGFQKHS